VPLFHGTRILRGADSRHETQLRTLRSYRINVDRPSGHSPQKQVRRRFWIQIRNDRYPRENSDSSGRGCSRWDLRLPVSGTQSASGLILTTSPYFHTPADEHVPALAGGPRPGCLHRGAARKCDQYKSVGGDSQDVPQVEGTEQAGELSFTL
jgi:hypothetical protein